MMKVIYSNFPIHENDYLNSIFLAGPTPRSPDVKSWRPEALSILSKLKFKGNVFVPEWDKFENKINYLDQVEWEWNALHNAKAIVFWIPRNLKDMPAFTTNVEFGRYTALRTDIIYGRPDQSCKNEYLDWLYAKTQNNTNIFNDLENLLKYTTDKFLTSLELKQKEEKSFKRFLQYLQEE